MSDSIKDYLNAIARYPLLTHHQEIVLARCVRKWIDSEEPTPGEIRAGKRAYQKLMNCNLRLVVVIAKKYVVRAHRSELLDLIQEGTLGMAQAVKKYDPERGYAFSTYSFWWIRQAVTRYLSQFDRLIRLPGNANDQIIKLRYWVPNFQIKHGRMPTLEECSEHTNVPPGRLAGYMAHINDAFSLDAPVSINSETALLDSVADPDAEDMLENLAWSLGSEYLQEMINKLSDKEQVILNHHFGLGGREAQSLTALGKTLGISRERVRQLETKALLKLRLRAAGAKVKL